MVKKLSNEDRVRIEREITRAEEKTSAEICVHVRRYCLGDPLKAAVKAFFLLGLNRTKGRSAVLIYMALSSRKVAIYGDKAINEMAGSQFWDHVLKEMGLRFEKGEILEGILCGVREVGAVLSTHFPSTGLNLNELTNTVSED